MPIISGFLWLGTTKKHFGHISARLAITHWHLEELCSIVRSLIAALIDVREARR
jgi:hypothetical protein